ncbi:MAG: metallophosphoesterase [Pseudomonadota bacterium]
MLRIIIFISIYLAVYGGMHLYFYRRLRRGFELVDGKRIAVIAFLVLMVFGPLLTRGLESMEWSVLAGPWALLVFGWMGVLFMSASLFLFVDIARFVSWLLYRVAHIRVADMCLCWRPFVIGVVSLSVVASLYGFNAARQIHIDTVTISTDKLPVGVTSYRMVQLTDVHLGVMTDEEWLQRIVAEVNALKPDLIVTTGDIIDSRIPSALPYKDILAQLQASDGKYAVAGNHEFFAGIDKSVAFMEEAGFVMLRGERAMATPWLHLMGVDDREGRFSDGAEVDHEKLLMQSVNSKVLNILLKHQPVIREESIGRFDLQLAGHVHQGQIFPFRLLTWIAYPVAMGLSELGNGSQLYVSRGTGTWGPPIRVMAPPEITVIEWVNKP